MSDPYWRPWEIPQSPQGIRSQQPLPQQQPWPPHVVPAPLPRWIQSDLSIWEHKQDVVQERQQTPKKPDSFGLFLVKLTGASLVGMVMAGVGLFLCLTIVGILPGVGLIIGAGLPMGIVMGRRIKSIQAWEHRDQPLQVDEPKPWE